MKTVFINTPLGFTEIQGDENGISKIHVMNEDVEISTKIPEELKEAVLQLQDYFDGKRTTFTFPLNPSGTDFQKKVWDELLHIPFGKTCSYLDLSKKLGDVKAIRAVASANGKNPLWIVVPCHRVISNNREIGGYTGGVEKKEFLLKLEQNDK